MNKRRKFSPEFKAQVVLSLLSGSSSMSEICRAYQLREQVVLRWKHTLLENAASVFENGKAEGETQERVAELERMLGRLTMENEILKKASGLLNFPGKKGGR